MHPKGIMIEKQIMALNITEIDLNNKIIIWDNDGTITGSKNPNDKTSKAKVILCGVSQKMAGAKFNFVISGFKSPESEAQNFDPKSVSGNFIKLMQELPINAVAFSPTIGGVECFVVIKKNEKISIIKAHENPKYSSYIGKFKKPDIGMFQVISDIALVEFGIKIDASNSIMIGDTWHDKLAAESFGIPFLEAKFIHASPV